MTSNTDLAYPAEYYYPEFIDNRPDDPRKSPPTNLPVISSIENGVGSSTKMPIKTTTTPTPTPTATKKKPVNRNQPPTSLAFDIVTDQGLADTDITQAVKADPKKSLVRDPAERNIPRLIVDENVLKQAVRTPRIVTTNLDNDFEQTTYPNQITNEIKPVANGHTNRDLTNKTRPPIRTKQQPIKYVENEPPVDDYWKKEVYIDDEGVVTIEPLKYDRNTYEGPFGLTRQGSFIFYIGVAIFTLLAGVFLIMTGIFYSQKYPSSSSTTGTLTGMGICAFAFYLGLQLILIGLWHQKYRQENPQKIVAKSNKHNDSSAHLKASMEQNEVYDYSYQQPIDYGPYADYSNPPYADYSNPPYVSNVNEQMLLQQPSAATGAGMYDPVVWPSNVQVETQPDSKFLQPMEWSFGPPAAVESPSTVPEYASLSNAPINNNKPDNKPEKKHHRRHHHNKKTVEAEEPKPQFDSIQPTSTVIEPPLPVFSKAPETNELMKSIAEAEKNPQPTPTTKNSNRVKPLDNGTDISSLNGHHHRHRHSHRRHHHQHRHHRRHSYSPCSTCSERSRNDFHSDIAHDHHHHRHRHHLKHLHSEPGGRIITPRPFIERVSSPPRRNPNVYREVGTGTGFETKIMKDSGVTADLEDVPNVRDNRLEQIPVVRRTIIVEPYPSEPTSQIIVKPQSNMIGKVRLSKNDKSNKDDEVIIHPTTAFLNKKSKKKKKTKESIEDLRLEDVNDDYDDKDDNTKSKKKNISRTTGKTNLKNAFYN